MRLDTAPLRGLRLPIHLLLTVLLLVPSAIRAQGAPGDGDVGILPAPAADLGIKTTSLSQETRILPGGWLGLELSPHTVLGGAGYFLGRGVRIPTPSDVDQRSLSFGYGGVRVEHLRPVGDRWAIGGSLLLGGGHAIVRNQRVGFELGADNLGVVEPEVAATLRLSPPLEVAVAAGFRAVFGVQDLPGVHPAHLRGATVTVSIRAVAGR